MFWAFVDAALLASPGQLLWGAHAGYAGVLILRHTHKSATGIPRTRLGCMVAERHECNGNRAPLQSS